MQKKIFTRLLLAGIFMQHFAAAQWSAPINISPGTTAVGTNENAGQCIAKSGDTLRIVYTDRSAALVKVMYNQSVDAGLTWGVPVIVQSSLNCSFTAIATYNGSVHIVWMDSLGSSRASFYRRSPDGGMSWQPVVCLDSVTKFWPGIACFGDLVVATLNKDMAGNTEVFIVRSLDNGSSWLPEQQVSHGPDRSEDPAINILGKDVHLSWNDKRSGTMNIYYCHSSDSGATWGQEIPLTSVDSYTSMVCLDSNHVDVPHGIRTGNYFDVWLASSSDTGDTWTPNQQLTNTSTTGEIYPFMVRDGSNLHVVYAASGSGANYLHSGDGGNNWDTAVFLSASSQPFIAYTSCVLHVIFSNAGSINYMRNPTGNCASTVVAGTSLNDEEIFIFPNPVSRGMSIHLSTRRDDITDVVVQNMLGEIVFRKNVTGAAVHEISVPAESLQEGIYFVKVNTGHKCVVGKIIM